MHGTKARSTNFFPCGLEVSKIPDKSRDQTCIRVLSPPIKIARTVPQARFSARVFVFGLFYTPFRSAQFLNSHVLQNIYPVRRANCILQRHPYFRKTKLAHACSIFFEPSSVMHETFAQMLSSIPVQLVTGLLQARYEKPRGGSRGAMTRSLSGR